MLSMHSNSKIALPNNSFFLEIKGLIEQGRTVTFLASGNSMRPFIRGNRDSVVLQKHTSLSVGDIVLAFIDNNRYVLHRVININNDNVTLMGDGNYNATETCSVNDILGKAIQIIRNGKNIDCESPTEQKKSHLWRKLLPIRRYLLFLYRLVE